MITFCLPYDSRYSKQKIEKHIQKAEVASIIHLEEGRLITEQAQDAVPGRHTTTHMGRSIPAPYCLLLGLFSVIMSSNDAITIP